VSSRRPVHVPVLVDRINVKNTLHSGHVVSLLVPSPFFVPRTLEFFLLRIPSCCMFCSEREMESCGKCCPYSLLYEFVSASGLLLQKKSRSKTWPFSQPGIQYRVCKIF